MELEAPQELGRGVICQGTTAGGSQHPSYPRTQLFSQAMSLEAPCPLVSTKLQLYTGPRDSPAVVGIATLSHSRTVAWIRHVTSSAIAAGEVSSLDHEVLDHTVELAALEAKSFLGVWRENTE